MSKSPEIPDSQPSSPAVSLPDSTDHIDDIRKSTKQQEAPTSSAARSLAFETTSGMSVVSAGPKSTDPSSGTISSHKANIHSPFRRPHHTGMRKASQALPSNPPSREDILQSDLSRLPLTAQNTSTNHPDYHRAQVVMVKNIATFTKQDLVSKLEELQNLLSNTSTATSSSTESSLPTHNTASCKTSSASQPSADLTPAQTQTLAEAQHILDSHVALLSRYNQMKDAGMAMLGILAEQKGVTVREIMAERGVDETD